MFKSKRPDLSILKTTLNRLSSNGTTIVSEFEKSECKLLLDKIKSHIIHQDLPWESLSPDYLEYKIVNNLDTGTWISTGELFRKLKVCKDPYGHYYVGAEIGERHTSNNILLNRLIEYLEYGTIKSPARPLYYPSKSELSITISDRVPNLLNGYIK